MITAKTINSFNKLTIGFEIFIVKKIKEHEYYKSFLIGKKNKF